MKTRITISLNPQILKELDSIVDGENILNRSNAIERILKERFSPKSIKKAFILAGGQGIRLRPLTYELPKPMVPIKGKPIMEYAINKLKEAGVSDIVISVGYLGEKVRDYFGDGAKFGVSIKYLEEKVPLGTAGPLRLSSNLFNDDFFMLNGDDLFDFDLDKMYEFHKKNRSLATIALTTTDNVSQFGAVEMEGNKITKFVEKPTGMQSTHLINAGIYILNPLIVSLIPEGKSSMEGLFEKLATKGKLNGFLCSGKWLPCDNMQLYEKALKNWP